MDEFAIDEWFSEGVCIKIADAEMTHNEAIRQAYFEAKRIFGTVPEVIRSEWKRCYEKEMKRDRQK